MKINLGSGPKRFDGFVNVDDDPSVSPDFLVDLESEKLPFDSNSVDEIKAHHILEHIGDGFIPLVQEMYRVCKNGAIIDIVVPHHLHEIFYGDPTHKRPITVNGMYLFSKKFCKENIEKGSSSSTLAFKYDVDFDMVNYEFVYDDFYTHYINSFRERMQNNSVSEQEYLDFQRLMREGNNVALETKMKMQVIKE